MTTYKTPTTEEQRASPYGQEKAANQRLHQEHVIDRIAWHLGVALEFARKGELYGFLSGEYIGLANALLQDVYFIEGVYERARELSDAARTACMVALATAADVAERAPPKPKRKRAKKTRLVDSK